MKMIKRSLRLPLDLDRRIKDYAVKYNWSYSKVIKVVLESWIYEN